MNTAPLTDTERALLVMAWPVERPDCDLTPEASSLVERGAMYVEPIGNGWYRHGLTKWGQSLADNIRDPFRRVRRA